MRTEYQLYIDGQWISQTDGCIRPDLEPATGYTLCQVHRAGPRDMERALASAQAAFADWSLTIADRRERILLRAADISGAAPRRIYGDPGAGIRQSPDHRLW